MKVLYLFAVGFGFFAACTSSLETYETQDKVDTQAQDSIPDVTKISVLDTISFDWFYIKENLRLLNCGERLNMEKRYLSPLIGKEFYYSYCAHNGNQTKDIQQANQKGDYRLLEAIVVKMDGEIGQYNERNEALLFLHVQAPLTVLGKLNWVGRPPVEVVETMGNPDKDTLHQMIYMGTQRALILRYSSSKRIESVKFYPSLHEGISIDELLNNE